MYVQTFSGLFTVFKGSIHGKFRDHVICSDLIRIACDFCNRNHEAACVCLATFWQARVISSPTSSLRSPRVLCTRLIMGSILKSGRVE
ncbi:hypothetical protein Y032_0010g978 [Ancylostoma ceylanicum]|uniref:Uncharacterized protein n=1 Tax=Ancylostoma ceylanicum TaxID=53326 RepID=A0A016VJ62_9BILA|nr:hypothetical protein Y032_0010g978 [Ancylostoma ceylanicum]